MFSAIPIKEESLTDDQWCDLYNLYRLLKERYKSNLTASNYTELKDHTLALLKREPGFNRSVILQGDRMVAWVQLVVRHAGTESQTAFFGFDGDFDRVPDELNRFAIRCVLPWMDKFHCPRLFFFSYNERTSAMARAWPAEEYNRLDTYVLRREAVNTDVLKEWLDTMPGQFPDLQLKYFPEIPDEHAEDFARLFIDFLKSMPHQRPLPLPYRAEPEDIRRQIAARKGTDRRVALCVLIDKGAQIVGLTCVLVTSAEPSELYQAMTGVVEGYRGKGLAKWLKAAMYLRMLEEIPSWHRIVTEMRSVNEPILHINSRIGYEFQSGGHEFVAERDVLETFVDGR